MKRTVATLLLLTLLLLLLTELLLPVYTLSLWELIFLDADVTSESDMPFIWRESSWR